MMTLSSSLNQNLEQLDNIIKVLSKRRENPDLKDHLKKALDIEIERVQGIKSDLLDKKIHFEDIMNEESTREVFKLIEEIDENEDCEEEII